MATTPVFVASPLLVVTNFSNSDSTNEKTLYVAPTAGVRIDKIFITSNDTTGRDVTIYLSDGTTKGVLDRVTLRPSTTARVISHWNVLDPNRMTALAYTDPEFTLMSGAVLSAEMGTAITSGKLTSVFIVGGLF